MKLAEFNNHCPRCPEKTETPVFDQMRHLHGFPGYMYGGPFETPHITDSKMPKVIEGTSVEGQKVS